MRFGSNGISLAAAPPIEYTFYALLYVLRGKMEAEKRDWGAAIADFKKASDRPTRVLDLAQGQTAEAYNERGVAKEAKGDLEGATSDMSIAAPLRRKRWRSARPFLLGRDATGYQFCHTYTGIDRTRMCPSGAVTAPHWRTPFRRPPTPHCPTDL
jgi:hypothetical protein